MSNKLKILIINLPRYKSMPVVREERCEFISKVRVDTPATLLIIASLARDRGHEVSFIDANALNLSFADISGEIAKQRFDSAIFSLNSEILAHDLQICSIVKEANPLCKTIGYSWYSQHYAKEIIAEYRDLDIFIAGPALSVVEHLLKCLDGEKSIEEVGGIAWRDGKDIKINAKLDSETELDALPMPAYDLLKSFKPYYLVDPNLRPYALIYTGKGCPFGCIYCNVARTKYSNKSVTRVMEELIILKKMGNIKYVWFFDEVFTINRQRVVEICENMLKEHMAIKWFCDTRVELVDEELLKLMRRAGCIGISFGVESGSQKILDAMKKGNTVEQARKALTWARRAKIPVQLNLILGFLGEDRQTLKETALLIKATLPETLQLSVIVAKPGTPFTRLAIENKWCTENANWKQHLNEGFELQGYLSPDLDLNSEVAKLRKMLYNNPRWWINCLGTLARNRELVLPAIKRYFRTLA